MHVLALDLGTSGAKAALIDLRTGETTAACSQPHPTHTLPGGGVEQSPEDWLAAARVAVAALPTDDVAALSVTGQMQDLICLDGSGAAIGRAILYNDTRATDAAAAIGTEVPDWAEITGNEQNATSNAAMLRRLHDSGDPRASADAVLFSPTGYLLHRLGLGQFVDPTTASTTGLMDLATRTWSREVCAAAHCSPGTLPEIRSGHVGDTADGNALGLPAGVPVVLAPGDAACTTLGIIGDQPGTDYLYLGTSGWCAQLRTDMQAPGPVHQLAVDDGILQIAAVLSAAGTADWARTTFLGGITATEADTLLLDARTPSGLLALPSLHGERFPVRNDNLRAAVIGMHAGTTGADLYRAVLEGVILALLPGMADTTAPLPVVGGGARSLPWMRIAADITGRPVQLIDDADAALTGCALAAVTALRLDAPGIRPLTHHPHTLIDVDEDAHAGYGGVATRHRRLYDLLGSV